MGRLVLWPFGWRRRGGDNGEDVVVRMVVPSSPRSSSSVCRNFCLDRSFLGLVPVLVPRCLSPDRRLE